MRQGEGARARAGEARDARAHRPRASGCRRSSRAASSSASRSRVRSCSSRRCCCSTSRCRTSTRSCAAVCAQEIRELQQSLSLTVLYVTHDQEEALAVSDHIIVMEGGRIAQQGTPHELYEAPASRFLADFIGDANLVDGELRATPAARRSRAGGVGAPVRARRHARRGPRRSRCGRIGCASSSRRGRAAGRLQARRLPRQPDRVRRRHPVGRACSSSTPTRARRAVATSRSASLRRRRGDRAAALSRYAHGSHHHRRRHRRTDPGARAAQGGHPVRVYEAAPEIKPVGVGVNMLPHATASWRARLERARATRGHDARDAFFNRFGQRIHSEPTGARRL